MTSKKTIRFIAIAALAAWVQGAQAQAAAPSYAIISLLADRLSVVTYQMGTGSHLDGNKRQEIALTDDSLDGVAAFAADDALKRLQPAAKTQLFVTRDANILALLDKALDADDLPPALLEGVKALVAKANAERLVVITRHRDDTRIRFNDRTLGSGRVSGVGFYIDLWTEVTHADSGNSVQGYVGPYAYVTVNVYELPGLRPLGAAHGKATRVVTHSRSQTAVVAWQSMSGTQKFDVLKEVIREAVTDTIPKVIR